MASLRPVSLLPPLPSHPVYIFSLYIFSAFFPYISIPAILCLSLCFVPIDLGLTLLSLEDSLVWVPIFCRLIPPCLSLHSKCLQKKKYRLSESASVSLLSHFMLFRWHDSSESFQGYPFQTKCCIFGVKLNSHMTWLTSGRLYGL